MKRRFFQLASVCATTWLSLGHALAQPTNATESGFGRPIDISTDGWRSDWLFNVTTVSISVLFVIMVAILFWAATAHRDKADRHAHYEHGIGKRHLMFTALISSIIFFGVDGTLLYNSFVDLTDAFYHYPVAADNPTEIEIYAQQWAWNVRYPGPDGKFNTADDVVVLNDVHIPVGKPVMLKLKSKDVIHSFYLPNFRTKQDAFPGAVTQLWFQAKPEHAGKIYEIGCAQHCGVNHYKMRGFLYVDAQADYDAWMKIQVADAQRRYDEADTQAHWGWDWDNPTASLEGETAAPTEKKE
jgi:cytochrome c oxidase subunit 2